MRVGTPLGEYPFEFRRVERRGNTVVLVGVVAGLESSVSFGFDDMRVLARRLALPIGGVALLLARRRFR